MIFTRLGFFALPSARSSVRGLGVVLAATALVAVAGCKKDEPSAGATSAGPAKPKSAKVSEPHYSIEIMPNGTCAVGADCEARVELVALGGYHVNKEYPYKFTAAPSKDVEYLGKDPAGTSVFTKSAGDYAAAGEERALMTVRFRAKAAGKVDVEGTYKFSVCSEQNCQIESAELGAKLDVK